MKILKKLIINKSIKIIMILKKIFDENNNNKIF